MFDIFNHRFFFRIGKKASNTTLFSILISLCVFLPLLILFLVLTVGALQRTTPHINVQEMDAIKRPSIAINTTNYRMGLKFQTKNGSILDTSELPKYFDIKVGSRLIRNNIEGQAIKEERLFDFQPCQKNDFLDFPDYYDMNLQKAICLKNHSVVLEGYWDESDISLIFIEASFCNKSKNALCKSKEEITNTFRGGYLYLHTETQNINSLNYERPLILTMKSIQFLIDTNVRNEVSLYLQKMEFSSFDGLIYNANAKTWDFYKQTYYTANSMSISQDENLIWSCFFLSSTKLLTIERYYSTLIDVAGTVGGISKFFIIIGFVITAIYNDRVLVYKLVKDLYEFNVKKKSRDYGMISSQNIPLPQYNHPSSSPEEEKKSLVSERNAPKEIFSVENSENKIQEIRPPIAIKNFPGSPLKNNTNVQESVEMSAIKQKSSQIEHEDMTSKMNHEIETKHHEISMHDEIKELKADQFSLGKDSLELSNCELFTYVFLPRFLYPKKLKRKVKLLKEGEENLHRYIDVYQMLKRFQEIENLKLILLNPRQLSLFNHLSKPNIVLNSELKWQKSSSKNFDISEAEIIETLNGKEKGNQVDSMLLEMLKEEIKDRIFNKFTVKY